MITYTDGDVVAVTTTFVDTSGTPVNPTAVEVLYAVTPPGQPAAGATTTLTYAGATTPGINVVAKTSTGTYVVWLDTTARPGAWRCEGKSTGTGQSASLLKEFQVLPGL
jgi:hypothetical protein